LHLAQCSQASTVLLIRHSREMRSGKYHSPDSSLHRTRLYCSRVQWRCTLYNCIRCFAFHLVI
ncbi:unnamed protein product, partial [Staurois parvus]